jgi:hypothetical protein
VKGELHVGTGGALFVQQHFKSNQVYAERMSMLNSSLEHRCAAKSELEQAGKVGNICQYT